MDKQNIIALLKEQKKIAKEKIYFHARHTKDKRVYDHYVGISTGLTLAIDIIKKGKIQKI